PIDVRVTYLAAHALPAPFTDDRKRFIREATQALEQVVDEKLAEAVDAFLEKGVFDIEEIRPLFNAAKKAGLAVTMHADQLNDVGASAFAARIRARSADHVAHASADGIRALARAEVPAVLLPGSAFFVGYAPPEARRFIAARVPVALASDHNPGTSPLEGMPMAIALGVTLCGLTPHEALVEAGPDYGRFSRRWPRDIRDPRRRTDRHDWGLEAELTRGETTAEPRARVIGGCSAHNECAAVWPPREDIDAWRVSGWSSAELWPLVDRVDGAPGGAATRGRRGPLITAPWTDAPPTAWQSASADAAALSRHHRLA